jgi:hypothetical protein
MSRNPSVLDDHPPLPSLPEGVVTPGVTGIPALATPGNDPSPPWDLRAFGLDSVYWHLRVTSASLEQFWGRYRAGEFPALLACSEAGKQGYTLTMHLDTGVRALVAGESRPDMGMLVMAGPRCLRVIPPEQVEPHLLDLVAALGIEAIGLRLNRADWAADVLCRDGFPVIDEADIVSRAKEVSTHRRNGRIQGYSVGKSSIRFTMYDKTARPGEDLSFWANMWGIDDLKGKTVVRFEWRLRRTALEKFGAQRMSDLVAVQGDIVRFLTTWVRLAGPPAGKHHVRAPLPIWTWLQAELQARPLGAAGVLPMAPPKRPNIRAAVEQAAGSVRRLCVGLAVERGLDAPVPREEALALVLSELETAHSERKLAEAWQAARLSAGSAAARPAPAASD